MPEPDSAALVEQVRSGIVLAGLTYLEPALTTLAERLEAETEARMHEQAQAIMWAGRAEAAEAEAKKLKDKLAFLRTAHKLTEDAEIARLRELIRTLQSMKFLSNRTVQLVNAALQDALVTIDDQQKLIGEQHEMLVNAVREIALREDVLREQIGVGIAIAVAFRAFQENPDADIEDDLDGLIEGLLDQRALLSEHFS